MKQFILCPECGMPILAEKRQGIVFPAYIFKCEYCQCEGFDYEVQLAKAISIIQPWTFLIAAGLKPIENRTWPTKYRGPVLLHAGKTKYANPLDVLSMEQYTHIGQQNRAWLLNSLEHSAIIGIASIVDCVKDHPSIWAEKGCYNWVMDKPILFENPIWKVKGKLSFFIPEIL